MDCLHFRSRTSPSKDALMTNALVRGGLSGCSTTASGSGSKLDEQCSCSRSLSADSEANLWYIETLQLNWGTCPVWCHSCRTSPVTVCWSQHSRFGLFLCVLLAHLPLFDCATVWFPTGLFCQTFGDMMYSNRLYSDEWGNILRIQNYAHLKIPNKRAKKLIQNNLNGGWAC